MYHPISKSFSPILMVMYAMIILHVLSPSAEAEEKEKNYSLFNPVPREEMRDMSTDRPDATESPFTVDAGHFQLEMTTYGRSEVRSREFPGSQFVTETIGDLNAKLGITGHFDVQVMLTLREVESFHSEHPFGPNYGVSNYRLGQDFRGLTARAKINLIGNNGGRVAVGLMPFARLPVGEEDDDHAYGIILPVAFDLAPISLGTMVQLWNVQLVRNQWNGLASAVFGLELTQQLGLYAEGIFEKPLVAGSDIATTISSGMTLGVSENVQLDLGILQGLTEHLDDFSYFVGLSVRR